jgi:hypothetical protein
VKIPSFLVIGAAKAGTTTFYHQLAQHPSIFMSPVKEPRYFSYDLRYTPQEANRQETAKTQEEYDKLFAEVANEQAVGEVSPSYLHSPVAPERIHAHNPDVRLIAILRHPVDRAESHYVMMLNTGHIPNRPFAEVFRERILNNPTWRDEPFGAYGATISLYHDALARYYEKFPKENIRILRYEDLFKNPAGHFPQVFEFLGVDPSFEPDVSRRENVGGGMPQSDLIHRAVLQPNLLKAAARAVLPSHLSRTLATKLKKLNAKPKPPLNESDRREFTEVYREDILKTQDLTGLDLSDWLAG